MKTLLIAFALTTSALPSWAALQTVTLPDASQWTLSLGQLARDPFSKGDPDCVADGGVAGGTPLTGSITHPSGAVGTFVLRLTEHGRSNVPGRQENCGVAKVSRYFATYSLRSKTLAGPGLAPMTWSYAYSLAVGSFDPCVACVSTKTVTITDPHGNVTRNTYGTRFGLDEGLLIERAQGVTSSGALRTTRHTYSLPTRGPFPALVGYHGGIADSMGRIHTPQESRVVTQQGVTFSQQATGFDRFARTTGLIRSSSLGFSRTESTTYYDQTRIWVLGQVLSQHVDGHVASNTAFDPDTALPLSEVKRLAERITTLPSNFKVHPLVEKVLADRAAMGRGEINVDWGMGEHLAFASLVASGYAVRLSGEDCGRGTFTHRHSVLHDQNREKWDEGTYTPLQHVAEGQAFLL